MYAEKPKLAQVIPFHQPLNQREKLFVQHYLTSNTATEAARLAGYESNPGSQASRLLRRERIRIAIDKARNELADHHELNRNIMVVMLLAAYERAENEGNVARMIQAVREIAVLCGFLPANRKHQ